MMHAYALIVFRTLHSLLSHLLRLVDLFQGQFLHLSAPPVLQSLHKHLRAQVVLLPQLVKPLPHLPLLLLQ